MVPPLDDPELSTTVEPWQKGLVEAEILIAGVRIELTTMVIAFEVI